MPYLDYNATTPVAEPVLDEMMTVFRENFGNPSSSHGHGDAAMELLDDARQQVASAVGREGSDVIFTSGATEANNTVLFGYGMDLKDHPSVLVSKTEHKSVLEMCKFLKTVGLEVEYISVSPDGLVDLKMLDDMVTKDMDVVSIAAANSETGVIQPVREMAKIIHEKGALFHCDATQAIGKMPFDAGDLDIDIVTMSSHKIYGPKGAGAIVATREARRHLVPMMYGGGQENEMRSGTQNVPGMVGFGMACAFSIDKGSADRTRQTTLRDSFERGMMESLGGITINGRGAPRLPNTSNMRIEGALADAVMVNAHETQISSGSACSSSTIEPSHVLTAMGLTRTEADESIRMSLGRPTTQNDIDEAISELCNAVRFVRQKETETARSMI